MKSTEKKSSDWTDWRTPGLSGRGKIMNEEPTFGSLDVLCRAFGIDVEGEEEHSWQQIMRNPHLEAVRHRHSDPYLGYNPPELTPSVSTVRLSAEVTALRRELVELKDEQRRSKEEHARWVRAIEQKIDELHGFDAQEVRIDPHTAWINLNRLALQDYPDTWVILDPEQGIVFDSKDEDELATKLAALSPEERERVMAFHTSLYA